MSDNKDSKSKARSRILVARRVPDAVAARAEQEFDAIISDRDLNAEEVIDICCRQGIEGILSGPRVRLAAADMPSLPDCLRIIANPSAGYDHMDVAAAKARGLVVTNTPDVLTDCTADLSFMLILNACRRAGEYFTIMKNGWRQGFGMPDNLGKRVSGQTIGIVGMGRIGQAVAARARGFNMRVLYTNLAKLPEAVEQGARYFPSLEDMLPHCDVLSLHMPGGSSTLMTREMFALLPRGAVFVNAARGSLVDEDALIDALKSGHLFAAGLDVYRKEPDFDRRLAELPNVFLTPHVASATTETRNQMGFKALDNIAAVLSGNPPINPV